MYFKTFVIWKYSLLTVSAGITYCKDHQPIHFYTNAQHQRSALVYHIKRQIKKLVQNAKYNEYGGRPQIHSLHDRVLSLNARIILTIARGSYVTKMIALIKTLNLVQFSFYTSVETYMGIQ